MSGVPICPVLGCVALAILVLQSACERKECTYVHLEESDMAAHCAFWVGPTPSIPKVTNSCHQGTVPHPDPFL